MTIRTGLFVSAGLALALVFSGKTGFGSETSELYVRTARERYADPADTNTCVLCFNIDKKYRFDLPSSTNETVRWIDVDGVRNVRDIGWTGLRRGRVYRGTELNKVGPHGLGLTAKGRKTMLEDLGIKTDLDLRAETKTARGDCLDKSALGPDVRFVSKPIRPYLEIFGSPLFAETVKLFADPTIYPVYIHCWGGADRTGCLSLVLEGLCGVPEVDLAIDYELTSFGCVGPRLRTGTKGAPFPEVLAKIKSFPGATLRDKFENFVLQDLKLSPEDVAAIRRNLECRQKGVALIPAMTMGREAPVAGKVVKVACIGDSITYGYAMTNRVEECYPAQLQRLLGAGYEVRNFGDSGSGVYMHSWRTFDNRPRAWRRRGEYEKALAFAPDIVISNLGINDAEEFAKELRPDFKTGKTDIERGRFVREYEELLKCFRAQNGKVRIIIWTRLAPCMKGHPLKGSVLPFVLSEDLENLAQSAGVEGLDMYAPLLSLSETADFCADGIHPEGGACKVIAEVTAKKITGK